MQSMCHTLHPTCVAQTMNMGVTTLCGVTPQKWKNTDNVKNPINWGQGVSHPVHKPIHVYFAFGIA